MFSWPFPQESQLYAYIFPKLLYPLNNISLCCSIYLIIFIAFERLLCKYETLFIFFFRYFAVCEPYKYRVEARPENVNIRIFKYLLIVITISCFINFPRFFETELVSLTLNRTLDTSVETVTILTYEVTELRKNPEYIR